MRVRKKTVTRFHHFWCDATDDWEIHHPKTSHFLYVLLYGIQHMLMTNQKERTRKKLGDIMFTGALLDWHYIHNNDDSSPVLFLWRVIGLEHAKEQYTNAVNDIEIQDPSHLYVLRQVVEFVRDSFDKELAVEVAKASCKEHQRIEKDGYDVSESYRQLALALKADGKSKVALPWMRKALEIQRRVLHRDDPDLYVSVNSIASILNSLSMFDEAIEFYEEAIQNRTRLLGEDHPKTLISMASYAFLLNKTNAFQKAKPYHHQVLLNRKKVLGIMHPKTLTSMINYANCLYPLGYLTQSAALLKKCYESRRKLLGEQHSRTKNAGQRYKKVYNMLKKAKEELDPELLS